VIERENRLCSLMDLENSSSSQQQPTNARGIITAGQTVLFRLPRGDIKSTVLKQNSYEEPRITFRVVELIVSGQFPSEKLGISTLTSLSGIPMDWHMRSWTRS